MQISPNVFYIFVPSCSISYSWNALVIIYHSVVRITSIYHSMMTRTVVCKTPFLHKASSVPFPHCIGSVFIPIILTLTLAGLQRSYPRNSVGLIARLAVASRPDKNLVVAMMLMMMMMMVMITRIMTSNGLFRATCFISMNSNPSNEVKNYHFWQNQVPARAVDLQYKLHTDI